MSTSLMVSACRIVHPDTGRGFSKLGHALASHLSSDIWPASPMNLVGLHLQWEVVHWRTGIPSPACHVCRAVTAPSRPAANNLQSRSVIFDDGCPRILTRFIVAETAVKYHKPADPSVRGTVLSLSAANRTRVTCFMGHISHNTLVLNETGCEDVQVRSLPITSNGDARSRLPVLQVTCDGVAVTVTV